MPVASMHAPRERIDWHAIKGRIDIETVAVHLLGEPPGRNGSRGLWWPCPLHDDRNPSLSVDRERGRWKCWAGCGRGDAAELAMKVKRGMTFPDAVRHVAELCGLASPSGGTNRPTVATRPVKAPVRPVSGPTGLPRPDAERLAKEAAERLWTPQGMKALDYLHDRGLTDATIRAARLGYTPGVTVPTKAGDRSFTALGVAIPWYEADRLTKIMVRQPDGREPKYLDVFSDGPKVFPSRDAIRPGSPLVLTEGEFDRLLLAQLIGDVASVVTLGSASIRADPATLALMGLCSAVYAAHDRDDSGDRAAASLGIARAVRVRPPVVKDWSDAHQAGIDLRCWWLPRIGGPDLLWRELSTWRWGPAVGETDDAASKLSDDQAVEINRSQCDVD